MNFANSDFQVSVLEKPSIICADVEALLGELVEGDLQHSLATRINSHVDSCPACQELKRTYLLTISLASQISTEEKPVPVSVQNRLRERLNVQLGLALPLIA